MGAGGMEGRLGLLPGLSCGAARQPGLVERQPLCPWPIRFRRSTCVLCGDGGAGPRWTTRFAVPRRLPRRRSGRGRHTPQGQHGTA